MPATGSHRHSCSLGPPARPPAELRTPTYSGQHLRHLRSKVIHAAQAMTQSMVSCGKAGHERPHTRQVHDSPRWRGDQHSLVLYPDRPAARREGERAATRDRGARPRRARARHPARVRSSVGPRAQRQTSARTPGSPAPGKGSSRARGQRAGGLSQGGATRDRRPRHQAAPDASRRGRARSRPRAGRAHAAGAPGRTGSGPMVRAWPTGSQIRDPAPSFPQVKCIAAVGAFGHRPTRHPLLRGLRSTSFTQGPDTALSGRSAPESART